MVFLARRPRGAESVEVTLTMNKEEENFEDQFPKWGTEARAGAPSCEQPEQLS